MSDIFATVSDSVGISDGLKKIYNNSLMYDDHSMYDGGDSSTINKESDSNRENSDGVGISDFTLKAFTQYIFNSDSVGMADDLFRSVQFNKSVSDNVGLADTIQRSLSIQRSLIDSLGIADVNSAGFYFARFISDSVGVSDFLKKTSTMGRKIVDTIGVSDEATRKFIASRYNSDSLGISDYISFITFKAVIDWTEPPKIDAIVIQPMPYTEPERMVIYAISDKPDQNMAVGSKTDVVFSGKMYDSHSLYNSHTPYYSGISNDLPPTNEGVYNI